MATATVTDFEVGDERIEELLAPHPEIAKKLELLAARRDEARGRMEASNTTVIELRGALERAERDLADLREYDDMNRVKTERKEPGSHDVVVERDDKRMRQAEERVTSMRARLDRTRERYKQLADEWGAYSNATNRAREYLRTLPRGFEIVAHEGERVSPRANETYGDAIARLRAQLAEIDAEAKAVKAAPIPTDDAKRLAREQVAKLAEEGRPDVSWLLKRGGPLRWPQQPLNGFDVNGSIPQLAKTVPMIAWMFADQLVEAIDREIELETSFDSPLSDAERKFKLAELATKRLEVERGEEELIEQFTEEGNEIARRRSVDPRALLGLASSMPEFKPV